MINKDKLMKLIDDQRAATSFHTMLGACFKRV